MKTLWILLSLLIPLALGSCSPSQIMVEDSPALAPNDTGVTTTVPTPPVVETGEWTNYQNMQAGYSAKYPANWMVSESVGVNGELLTTFMAPDDGQGIAVTVLTSEAAVEEIPDMPNTRCQQVTISGLSGQRCVDTVASSISTTIFGHGKQYAIVAIGKHPDQNIYQSFLENFTATP